jgi:hypothetical protein
LLSDEEMHNAMKAQGIDREDMYEATIEIVNKIEEYGIEDHRDLLPVQYQDPDGELLNLAMEGLKDLGLDQKQEYIDH